MGYAYDQRKQPKVPQNTEPERTNAPGPVFSAPNPGASIPPAGPSFDLNAAMRERMANTFGDLSAVRDYTPPGPDPGDRADRTLHRFRHSRDLKRFPLSRRGGTHAGQEGQRRAL